MIHGRAAQKRQRANNAHVCVCSHPLLPQVTSELTAVIKEISQIGDADGGESGGTNASAKLGELMDRLTKLKATVRTHHVCC